MIDNKTDTVYIYIYIVYKI